MLVHKVQNDLLQHLALLTKLLCVSPARRHEWLAGEGVSISVPILRVETRGPDVGAERHLPGEAEESDVVVARRRLVAGVPHHAGHGHVHGPRAVLAGLEVVLGQAHADRGALRRGRAVRGRQHEQLADEGAAAVPLDARARCRPAVPDRRHVGKLVEARVPATDHERH